MSRTLGIALVLLAAQAGRPGGSGGHDSVTSFAVPAAELPAAPDAGAVAAPDADVAEPEPDGPPIVPAGNRERGEPPDPSSAEQGARKLFEAIRADEPALAMDFLFPAPAFDLVKNMDDPGTYHRKLVRFFEEDVHTEHARYWAVDKMEFDGFEMGACAWQEPYTQGNRLAYWSCRNSRILARSGTKVFDFRIKVLINWGDEWYVIHLGPIRSL
jgi:hypothetical protein